MTDKHFYEAFIDALAVKDRDEFISDHALSSVWGDAENAEVPAQRLDDLGALWDVAHTGLTRTSFALRYLIPYRTVENWERGDSQCPDYVRLLLAQVTGFYRRPEV